VEKVTDSVFQIRTPMGVHYVNCHLVVGGHTALLVDTGLPETYNLVSESLDALKLPPGRLRLALITHGHPDHIGSNARLRTSYPLQIMAPAAAAAWIEDHERQFREFPAAFPQAFDPDEEFKQSWLRLMDAETPVDIAYSGAIQVNLGGGVALRSIEYPGHSSHETAYYEPGTKCLILGDAIALDHPDGFPAYEHPNLYRRSLQSILEFVQSGEVEKMVAGHFEIMNRRAAEDLLSSSLQRTDEIEAAVLQILVQERRELTLRQVCAAVAATIGRSFNFQTPWTVYGHLKCLAEAGLVAEQGGCWHVL
jgi:glyoxylase-like metal-dependent hydrolase (beta-lactamase superfamily II)